MIYFTNFHCVATESIQFWIISCNRCFLETLYCSVVQPTESCEQSLSETILAKIYILKYYSYIYVHIYLNRIFAIISSFLYLTTPLDLRQEMLVFYIFK